MENFKSWQLISRHLHSVKNIKNKTNELKNNQANVSTFNNKSLSFV